MIQYHAYEWRLSQDANLYPQPFASHRTASTAQSLGLTFHYLVAADGRALTARDRAMVDHERRKRITPYPLTDNEVGCWLSHRAAMQNLIDSGQKMAAIVEDDAVLSPDFPKALAAIEDFRPPFDVIDLHRDLMTGRVFLRYFTLLPDCDLGRVGYMHLNATAYVISRAGALKFVSNTLRFTHAIDEEMHRYWANGLDIYGLEKPVAVQDDGGYSYIDETRKQDCPKNRLRYPDADRLYWRFQRGWTHIREIVRRRRAFAAYRRANMNGPSAAAVGRETSTHESPSGGHSHRGS